MFAECLMDQKLLKVMRFLSNVAYCPENGRCMSTKEEKDECLYLFILKPLKEEETFVVRLTAFWLGGLQNGSGIECKLDFATDLDLNVII